jgi:hypothetical protein
MRCTTCSLIGLLIVPGLVVCAQQPIAVSVGQRVRVRTDSEAARVVTGTLVGQDSLAIKVQVVQPELTVVTVPLARIKQLEVRTGRQSNAGSGALIGFGVGAGLGLAMGITAANDSFLQADAGEVVAVTVVTGLVGAGIGSLVGLATGGDRWEVVRPAGMRISLVPRRSSVLVGLSLTF